MLPPKIKLPPDQQRLLKLYRQLTPCDREGLLSYAEFLQHRAAGGDGQGMTLEEQLPADIPRPESETVVAAMRRLSRTFYMIDKGELLHEASELMTAHLMQGRPAAEVIDELEVVFRRRYAAVGFRPDPDER